MNFKVGLSDGAKYLLETHSNKNRDEMNISLAELIGRYYAEDSAINHSAIVLGNHVLIGYENKKGQFMAETLDEVVMKISEIG